MQDNQIRPAFPARRYLTTAIPYVNAAPHVGFALELVQADALARFYRAAGDDVRFQAGSDENSIKNVQAADAAGLPVAELVERNAARFLALKERLDLSFDDFIRTSADPRHQPGVERLWKAAYARDDIYKRAYRGLYCTGCEQFYRPVELSDGCCPEHGTIPELVEEENWFFRLSHYADRLRELYAERKIEIVPESRRSEIVAFIDNGVEDFSVSRSATRARGWGIPVPGDPDQVIYVWFDALANYITALGYGTDAPLLARYWTNANAREHVIGKGISRFHAIYWPAILLSAGLPVPTRIFVHGYVTVDGRKIGKSAGNSIDPVAIVTEFGTDALRYFLLRHIRSTGDGDFSYDRLRQAYESELADQLGNLVHRVLTLIERHCAGVVPAPPEGFLDQDSLYPAAIGLQERVAEFISNYNFDRALDAVWSLIAEANRYVSEEEPWALAKKAASCADAESAGRWRQRLHGCLFSLSATLALISSGVAPLLPATCRSLNRKLGLEGNRYPADPGRIAGNKVRVGKPLFPKQRPAVDEAYPSRD